MRRTGAFKRMRSTAWRRRLLLGLPLLRHVSTRSH
jgi:hypothetical protein